MRSRKLRSIYLVRLIYTIDQLSNNFLQQRKKQKKINSSEKDIKVEAKAKFCTRNI
jgi:hypothetical protein